MASDSTPKPPKPETMPQMIKMVGPKLTKLVAKVKPPRMVTHAPLKSPMRNIPHRPTGGSR